jgi:hypothetical protein
VDYQTVLDELAVDAEAATASYFQDLAADQLTRVFIASVMADGNPKAAERLADYGTTRITTAAPIELRRRASGGVYATNVKWCGSRYCPTCGPRISGQRRFLWSEQANAAAAEGWFTLVATLSAGTVDPGGLRPQLDTLQQEMRRAFPSPSRWPKGSKIPGYLGVSWALEPDFITPNEEWNPHIHASFWFTHEPTSAEIEVLRCRWQLGKVWLEPAKSAGAWAAYSAKGQPLASKPHNLGLFDLARQGRSDEVGEFLYAMYKRRMAQGPAALQQFGKDADDAVLLAAADQTAPGDVLMQELTVQDWRTKTGR